MADTVAKSNQAERELERRVVQYQVEKEQTDALKEQYKKEETRRKLSEIKRTLDSQVNAKKMAKQQENYMNDQYMKKWMQIAEEDNLRRREEEERGKKKKLEVKDFLLMQMGSGASVTASVSESVLPGTAAVVAGELNKSGSKKAAPGKAMNIEELRINKQLLKEISKRKKAK